MDTIDTGIAQLVPHIAGTSPTECRAWAEWTRLQPNYYWAIVGEAVCITKVYNRTDPPWDRVAHEVAWWGHGRDAVRALHRAMAWARLQGATMFGYSLLPCLKVVKWRRL